MSGRAGLLLFDIDGTLVLTGGAGRRAMDRTMAEMFGISGVLAGIDLSGRTDTDILSLALAKAGLDDTPDVHARFRAAYTPVIAEEVQQPGDGRKGVMPGVHTLLERLRGEPGAQLALLTGNYREGARAKLEHFDLWSAFPWGAFGDEAADRNELARIALRRAIDRDVPAAALENVIVIGDTPFDIACAAAIGARIVAVATGGYSADRLRAAGAELVLPDLGNGDVVLDLLNGGAGRG